MMSLYRVEIRVVFGKLWIRCGVNAYGYILRISIRRSARRIRDASQRHLQPYAQCPEHPTTHRDIE